MMKERKEDVVDRGLPILLRLALALFTIFSVSAIVNADAFGWLLLDVFTPNFWAPTIGTSAMAEANHNWITLSFFGLSFLTLVMSLAYMFGSWFGPKVQAWAKQQLVSIAKSVILLIVCAAAFSIVTAAPDTFAWASRLQIDGAINFAETMRNTVILEFLSVTSVTAILSMIGNITPYLKPAGMIGISFSLAPAFRPIFDSLGIMLSTLSISVGTWFLQLWLLLFIKTRMLELFLPIGLFLRGVGLNRGGNILIALAIGFFFIYPFMMNITAYSLERYLSSEFGGERAIIESTDGEFFEDYSMCVDHTKQFGSGSYCFFKITTLGTLSYVKEMVEKMPATSLVGLGILQFFTGSLPATIGIAFVLLAFLALIKTTVFYVLIASILVPLFNVFITLTAIKELVKFLGTDIDLSAFEKLF